MGASTSSNATATAAADDGSMTLIVQCEEKIQKNLSDPKVKILREILKKSGRETSIKAINCEEENIGGQYRWSGEVGEIELCSNRLDSEETGLSLLTALRHELVHAYDACRGRLTLNINHLACSEIRAYRLSDGCHVKKLRRGLRQRYLGFNRKEVERECVKQGAIGSLSCIGYSADEAKSAAEANWSRCYRDTVPFGPELYHSFGDI